jgi:uncharacterized protein DUF6527
MGIPLRIVQSYNSHEADGDDGKPPIGAMWREPGHDVDGIECWAILLPNRAVWYTTQTTGRVGGVWQRWTVTGTPPLITVTPSIDDRDPHNPWHGWIRDGELVPA